MRSTTSRLAVWLLLMSAWLGQFVGQAFPAELRQDVPTAVISLDGDDWQLAVDSENLGREQQWYLGPTDAARPTKVPWIIQDVFPGYHGLAWYWRTFTAPANPRPGGRCLLRFWAVDYQAEVWLNGTRVGKHEGGESPFVLDVTEAVKPGGENLLAVRVLNPIHEPIDGIVLNQTPHRNKALPYGSGSAWNQGGIMESVELLVTPAVRIADLFARPDWQTGEIRVRVEIDNSLPEAASGHLEVTVAPAASGETLAAVFSEHELPAGVTEIETTLQVENPHLWNLNDPFLYRVTARVRQEGAEALDECSVRSGFRDFRFENGYFRLNGRRLYLRCSHTGNCCPIGLELPHDPDILRRDLLNVKAMGFNAIRFIAGVAKRYQLDLCDEIGLMVYEESYAAWCLADSPRMPERYDESVLGMVRRDRNHASVVIWGLLNETPDGPVFRHAAGLLPTLRQLDDSRLVMLNSGRWDAPGGGVAGIEVWRNPVREDPCVTFNPTDHTVRALGIAWEPGRLALHPGRDGEYGVVRWTAPAAGDYEVSAVFTSIAERATTDVHVLHNGRSLFGSFVNLEECGMETNFAGKLSVANGDTMDCAVGFGNKFYGADTTALDVKINSAAGDRHDAARDFSVENNPNGPWSYGLFTPGDEPDASTFALYPKGVTEARIGSLGNPGSAVWEDVLSDQHPYQRVPHTADVIHTLRSLDGQGKPVFVSEYGVGSAVDLVRVVRLYEQLGKGEADDARFYRQQRDRFLADWQAWRMADTFDR
ncbi:MAG: sugar-binding domain-containing protein, partial [Planctomycetota bacterium]